MAENKKSFILYADLLQNIDHLTNEEKGILFTHLLEYVNDKNPVLKDRLILTAWKPIERQLKRDLIKFEDVKILRSKAGKESARIRALNKTQQNPTNSTRVDSVKHRSTNPTDNVNDNDNVINIPTFESFLSYAQANDNKISPIALKHKYEAWVVNGWKDGKDNKIKNWKVKLLHTLQYIDKVKEETTWIQNGLLGNQ